MRFSLIFIIFRRNIWWFFSFHICGLHWFWSFDKILTTGRTIGWMAILFELFITIFLKFSILSLFFIFIRLSWIFARVLNYHSLRVIFIRFIQRDIFCQNHTILIFWMCIIILVFLFGLRSICWISNAFGSRLFITFIKSRILSIE